MSSLVFRDLAPEEADRLNAMRDKLAHEKEAARIAKRLPLHRKCPNCSGPDYQEYKSKGSMYDPAYHMYGCQACGYFYTAQGYRPTMCQVGTHKDRIPADICYCNRFL